MKIFHQRIIASVIIFLTTLSSGVFAAQRGAGGAAGKAENAAKTADNRPLKNDENSIVNNTPTQKCAASEPCKKTEATSLPSADNFTEWESYGIFAIFAQPDSDSLRESKGGMGAPKPPRTTKIDYEKKSSERKLSAATPVGSETLKIPYGNFGLNGLSGNIGKIQNSIEEQSGIRLFFDYYAVLLSNPYGGASQGTDYSHEMIYGLNLNLDKLLGWKNANFVVSGAYNAGGDLSDKIGNAFTASESYVTNGVMLYQIYLKQSMQVYGGEVSARMGRVSMSGVFGSLPAFGNLVSGGIDSTPEAIFYNSSFTSSPIATWGADIQYETIEDLSFAAGIYQAPKNLNSPNWDGCDMGISSKDGFMMMFQAAWSPTFFAEKNSDGSAKAGTGLDGIYQIGGYYFGGYDTGNFNSDRENGYGFYAQAQQMLWRDKNNPGKYVSAWVGAQISPVESVSLIPWMGYAGIQLQGFVPQRPSDGIYFSWLGGWFSKNQNYENVGYNASYEMVVEATYVIQLNDNISIQPDIQYIFRPYGNDAIDDSLVIGGQLIVSF